MQSAMKQFRATAHQVFSVLPRTQSAFAPLPTIRIALIIAVTAAFVFSKTTAWAATVTASTPSYSDVSAAISRAASGDIVHINSGSATWTAGITVSKNVTIEGEGASSTVINLNMGEQAAAFVLTQGAAGTQRVTGIGFIASVNRQGIGVWPQSTKAPYSTVRQIDNCNFTNLYAGVWVSDSFGVTQNCTFTNCFYLTRMSGFHGQQTWTYAPIATDSINFWFIQNCTGHVTGDALICDGNDAQPYCVRNNSFTFDSKAQCFPIFDAHGDYDGSTSSGIYGAITTLIYGNTLTFQSGAQGYPLFDQRGGVALVFNNTVTGSGGSAEVRFREETYEFNGWKLPASDVVNNTYVWNNTLNGTVDQPSVMTTASNSLAPGVSATSVIKLNQQYWIVQPTTLRLPPADPYPSGTPAVTLPNAPGPASAISP